MELLAIVAIVLGLIILVSVMQNQVMFAFALLLFTFVIVVVYLWNQKKPRIKPLDEFVRQLKSECFAPEIPFGNLILGGDYRHQERIRGRIAGYTVVRLEPTEVKEITKEARPEHFGENQARIPKEAKPKIKLDSKLEKYVTLYCIMYLPPAFGTIGKIVAWVASLPILSSFLLHYRFLFVTKEQLFGNDKEHPLNSLTGGDIKLGAMSVTSDGPFEFLNVQDLDKDVISGKVAREVDRITMYHFFNDQAEVIGRAIDSDSSHEKAKEIINPDSGDYGIKRS